MNHSGVTGRGFPLSSAANFEMSTADRVNRIFNASGTDCWARNTAFMVTCKRLNINYRKLDLKQAISD